MTMNATPGGLSERADMPSPSTDPDLSGPVNDRSSAQQRHGRPRVLVIAEMCNPEWVSVPLVGWQHAVALREVADVHLVTQVRNREALARTELVEGDDFTSIDSEAIAAGLWRLGSLLQGGEGKGFTTLMAASAPSYYYFEHLLWKRFAEDLKARRFDLVHRLTPLSPTHPSLLARKLARIGVPFVLGPLNGGIPWPKGFDAARRAEREWLSYVRDAYRLLPGYRSTRAHAAAIIVGSRATLEQMPRRYHDRCVYIPENAVDPRKFSLRRTRTAELPLRLVFVGRLVPYKGADMLLHAAAPLLRAGKVRVDIIGDGPQRGELEGIIEQLDIGAGVRLRGWVEHAALQHELASHDVLAFPSVREFGGGVVLEAMAVGLVPLVVDYGGPAELVTRDTGLLIAPGSRSEIIERLRAALGRLAEDPGQVDRMSPKAVEQVIQGFTWQAKAQQVRSVYEWVLGRGPRPHLVPPDRSLGGSEPEAPSR